MTQMVRSRLRDGIWEAEFKDAGMELTVSLNGAPLDDVVVKRVDARVVSVSVPIPADRLSEGVHSFNVCGPDDLRIGGFTIAAGDVVANDLLSELELVKAELDLLKKAFRRHLRETM